MEQSLSTTERKLPTLQELYNDSEKSDLQKAGELSVLLNSEPKAAWIQVNKYANNTRYIGIGTLEWLMTYVWRGRWHLETKGYSLVANAIACDVRVHYWDWTTSEWRFTDGVGAAPLQLDSAKDVSRQLNVTEEEAQRIIRTNATAYVKSSAVQMALPAAESFAFKDAVQKLGRIFGKDLNRRDAVDYLSLMSTFEVPDEPAIPYPRQARMENATELLSVEAVIVDVKAEPKKAKKKGDKDYTMYTVILDNGTSMVTFDDGYGETAKGFQETADTALIDYREEKNGRRILNIVSA